MIVANNPTKVFTPQKPHSSAKKILLFIEILSLVLVATGTFIFFFRQSDFSFQNMWRRVLAAATLKKQNLSHPGLSFEGQVRDAIDGKVLSIVSIESQGGGFVTIRSKEGVEVIFSSSKDLNFQVSTLQTLLSKAKIEQRVVLLVDFRFDKLVVRYE
jgi:molybdopterin-binding protein